MKGFSLQEDNMAFGKPTKYWKLDINKVDGGVEAYDEAIQKASDVYVSRMVSCSHRQFAKIFGSENSSFGMPNRFTIVAD